MTWRASVIFLPGPARGALTRRSAQTLLTAQAYILVNHPFTDAADGATGAKLRKAEEDGGALQLSKLSTSPPPPPLSHLHLDLH